jgi:dCMP deaminase
MDKWDVRFMQMAEVVATWSSCARAGRAIGAVIVKDKRILTTGYNGAPQGIQSCKDKGYCMREKLGIESGTRQEQCFAVHAEQNAIAQASKLGVSVEGATMYVTHQPCTICTRIIINSGIKRIIYKHSYPDDFSVQLLKDAGVELIQFQE